MSTLKEPTFGNGKICYKVMPAIDVNHQQQFIALCLTGTSGNGKMEVCLLMTE